MASIDYQGAKKEIDKIFSQSIGERKIVFWYDAPKNFEEDIKLDSFDNCRLLICDRNEFEIKKTIEHDDLISNFLIYIPSEKPKDTENWLLDILMYSEEYYADTVALIMRRFNLTNTDLRKVIENYSKFFDSEARSKKLSSYVKIDDNMTKEDLKVGMMSVLTKASSSSIESILTELVFDDSNHSKYNELVKFKFEDYLWDQIYEYFNYEGDLKIETLIKRFMFTAFLEQIEQDSKGAFANLPSYYDQFIIKEKGVNDARYFISKIKDDKRYELMQSGLAIDMRIDGLISTKDIISLQNADIFEYFDVFIIDKIAQSLQSGSLDYEAFERVIYNRINSMWYSKFKNEYETLLSGIKFLKRVEKPISKDLYVNDYIEKYTNSYYKIDKEYRHACTNFKKINSPSEYFENLIDGIELLYQTYLENLGGEYSKALSMQDDWNFVGVEMTSNFYQYIQKHPAKKMFVIISDALRYEIGYEIFEQVKVDPVLKGGADIEYAISPLPSETRQGMACLLPHREVTYENKSFYVDGMSTSGIEARNTVLQSRNKGYSAIQFDKINSFTRNELRQYMQDKSLVYIYHDVIDNAGEHNESKVFDVVQTAIEEILALVKKLYNNLQISNFYITADHGFLYRRNEISESNKYSNIVSLKPTEVSKRYVLTDDEGLIIPYTTEFKLKGLANINLKAITPNGYDLFKTQGGGLQYIHGGASLQETIVPIIHISELRSSKLKETIRPVGVRLKSVTRKITNRSFTLEFEQYEKVAEKKQPITCETFIVDELGNEVSNVYKFVANSSSDDPTTRISRVRFTLKNIEFDRNKPYFMVLRNIEKSDEYIEKEPFTIDIIGFKMF